MNRPSHLRLEPSTDDVPARVYAIPSCSACLRQAEKHGLSVGQRLPEGTIEAFVHCEGRVQALVEANGFLAPIDAEALWAVWESES